MNQIISEHQMPQESVEEGQLPQDVADQPHHPPLNYTPQNQTYKTPQTRQNQYGFVFSQGEVIFQTIPDKQHGDKSKKIQKGEHGARNGHNQGRNYAGSNGGRQKERRERQKQKQRGNKDWRENIDKHNHNNLNLQKQQTMRNLIQHSHLPHYSHNYAQPHSNASLISKGQSNASPSNQVYPPYMNYMPQAHNYHQYHQGAINNQGAKNNANYNASHQNKTQPNMVYSNSQNYTSGQPYHHHNHTHSHAHGHAYAHNTHNTQTYANNPQNTINSQQYYPPNNTQSHPYHPPHYPPYRPNPSNSANQPKSQASKLNQKYYQAMYPSYPPPSYPYPYHNNNKNAHCYMDPMRKRYSQALKKQIIKNTQDFNRDQPLQILQTLKCLLKYQPKTQQHKQNQNQQINEQKTQTFLQQDQHIYYRSLTRVQSWLQGQDADLRAYMLGLLDAMQMNEVKLRINERKLSRKKGEGDCSQMKKMLDVLVRNPNKMIF